MITSLIQAVIFYSHTKDEVAELAQAIRPLSEHIRAVSSDSERQRLRAILAGDHFRCRDVSAATIMLTRAANHVRGHLDEYFPLMQQTVIEQAEALEDAVGRYRERFKALASETIPVS